MWKLIFAVLVLTMGCSAEQPAEMPSFCSYAPSVVRIFKYGQIDKYWFGSAFVADGGMLVTAKHVADVAEEFEVEPRSCDNGVLAWSGVRTTAWVLWKHPTMDVAVLRPQFYVGPRLSFRSHVHPSALLAVLTARQWGELGIEFSSSDGVHEVLGNVVPGSSGGAVVDVETGLVVGVVVRRFLSGLKFEYEEVNGLPEILKEQGY